MGRIEKKIDENLAEDQLGLRKNGGTRETVLCLGNKVEKSVTVNKKVYIYCLCRLTESFWRRKLERNDEDTEDDKK